MTNPIRYTEEQLRNEINRALDGVQAVGAVMHPLWITHGICREHRPGLADVDEADEVRKLHIAFWEFGGYTVTRKVATACINERDGAASDEGQQVLFPEFECLQRYYVIRRGGVDVGVPVMECTDDELRAKAALYRAQSTRLEKHAQELIRFIDFRAALPRAM